MSNYYGLNGSNMQRVARQFMTTPELRKASLNHRDTKPVPPLSEYEAYYETLSRVAQKKFNPRMMRRLAIVVREGNRVMQAAKLIGLHPHIGSSRSYVSMPDHLK